MIGDGVRQTTIFIEKNEVQPDIAIFKKVFDRRVIEPALRPHDRHQANGGRPRASVSVNAAMFERPRVHLVAEIERAKGVKQQRQAHEHIARIRILAGVMNHLRQQGAINTPHFDGGQDREQVQRFELDVRGEKIRAHEPTNPLHHPRPGKGSGSPKNRQASVLY